MLERSELVELPEDSWRSLKAYVTGWMGEIFALVYVSQHVGPPGELWVLRPSLTTTAWWVDYSWEGEQLEREADKARLDAFLFRELATMLLPPRFIKLPRGVPEEVKRGLERFLGAWLPESEKDAAKVLAQMIARRYAQFHGSLRRAEMSEDAVREELVKALLRLDYVSRSRSRFVLKSPSSDFAAFDLINYARRWDLVLIRFESMGPAEEDTRMPEITFREAPPSYKCGWVVEVEPRSASHSYSIALRLWRALKAGRITWEGGVRGRIRERNGRLFVPRKVSREELERAIEAVKAEIAEEFERRLARRVPVFRARLKGVEILEVKAGSGKLSELQAQALEELRRLHEEAECALGRSIEVNFRVLRISFRAPLEVPRSAVIESQRVDYRDSHEL